MLLLAAINNVPRQITHIGRQSNMRGELLIVAVVQVYNQSRSKLVLAAATGCLHHPGTAATGTRPQRTEIVKFAMNLRANTLVIIGFS